MCEVGVCCQPVSMHEDHIIIREAFFLGIYYGGQVRHGLAPSVDWGKVERERGGDGRVMYYLSVRLVMDGIIVCKWLSCFLGEVAKQLLAWSLIDFEGDVSMRVVFVSVTEGGDPGYIFVVAS